MSETTPKAKLSTASLILLLLLLASVAGNIYQFFNTRQIVIEKEKTILRVDSLATRKAELEIEFNHAVEELESYKGKSKALDSLLAEANTKLEEQKKKIAYLIDQNEGYDILRQRYAELNEIKNSYLKKIEELEAQNAALRAENVDLKVKIDQKDAENTELKGKVDVAAKLKISSVSLKAYNVKNSGKTQETDKASKTDRLAIIFNVDDNPLAANGDRFVYLRIINPEGFVLADVSQSIRKFTTDKGVELPYSRYMSFSYTGDKVNKQLNWDNSNFKPGEYKVELYIDNYYAGEGKIMLK